MTWAMASRAGCVLAHDGARRRRHHQRRRHGLAQHALRRRSEEETGGAGLALRAEHDEAGLRVGGRLEDLDVRQPDPDVDGRRLRQRRGRDRRRERGERLPALALDPLRVDRHRRGLHEERLDDVQQRQGGPAVAIGPRPSGARHRMADDVRRGRGKIHGAEHERRVGHCVDPVMIQRSRRPGRTSFAGGGVHPGARRGGWRRPWGRSASPRPARRGAAATRQWRRDRWTPPASRSPVRMFVLRSTGRTKTRPPPTSPARAAAVIARTAGSVCSDGTTVSILAFGSRLTSYSAPR